MISEEIVLPSVLRQSKLIYPHQPYHDDFLETIRGVFRWSRCFGVVGATHSMWKCWGIIVLLLLFAIEVGSIYKLIKLLAGLTAYSAGNRSVTARLAGVIFYTSSMASLILSWRLSSVWSQVSAQWVNIERRSNVTLQSDGTLKRRMITAICVITVCATVEHVLSMLSAIGLECPPSQILEKYILDSHAFILIPSDYSIWVAIPIFFMSNIATILWNFQDLLVVLISMGLTSRYHRLNRCVSQISKSDRRETNWCKNVEVLKVHMWRKVRDAYVKQAMLVRIVDKKIGGLILLSSFGNFYFICLQLFLGITQGISGDIIKRIYYMVSFAWLCIRYICVVLAAADINVHSKLALRYLNVCQTRWFNTEMASAVMTYELVLIQFDTKGFSGQVPLNLTSSH